MWSLRAAVMNFKACAVTATSSSTAVVVTPPAVVKGSFIRRERNNKNRRVIRADANGHTPIFFADVQKSIQSVDVGLLHGCSVLLVHWKARAAFGNGFSGRGGKRAKAFPWKEQTFRQLSAFSLFSLSLTLLDMATRIDRSFWWWRELWMNFEWFRAFIFYQAEWFDRWRLGLLNEEWGLYV